MQSRSFRLKRFLQQVGLQHFGSQAALQVGSQAGLQQLFFSQQLFLQKRSFRLQLFLQHLGFGQHFGLQHLGAQTGLQHLGLQHETFERQQAASDEEAPTANKHTAAMVETMERMAVQTPNRKQGGTGGLLPAPLRRGQVGHRREFGEI